MLSLLALFFCALLVWAANPTAAACTPRRGGTLGITMEGDVSHLDGTVVLGKFYCETAGSNLVMVNENYEIVGDLAHKWEFSDEGRVITFHLRPGAKFHDGTPLDAEAVKWNFDLTSGRVEPEWVKEEKKKNPKFNSSYYLYQVKKVEVVDKTTVRLHLQDLGKGMTLPALVGYFTRMVFVSPKAYNKDNHQFRRRPVNSGPFKVVDYKHNQFLIMERFKDYYNKESPCLDRVEVHYMPDVNQRLNALRSGQFDVIFNVPKPLVATLKAVKGVVLHTDKAATVFALPINNQRGPWKDISVRKAVGCYGLVRALVVRTALRGFTQPWATFTGPGARDAIDLTAKCPFDPAKAKGLLAEAGFGPSRPFRFTIWVADVDPTHDEAAQILKTIYARIGVQMDIQKVDRATWSNLYLINRVTGMVVTDTTPAPDINSYSNAFYSKTFLDLLMTKDAKLDGMLEEWRSTIVEKRQIEISHRMQRYILDQAYYPMVGGSPFYQATRDNVKGFAFLNKINFTLRDV